MLPAYQYKATVVRIVDGDTVVLSVDLGFSVSAQEKFRLAHINAPEKADKDGWAKATSRLAELLPLASACTLKSLGQDKYGRWLGEIYVGDLYVNGVLLDEGLAVAYEGRNERPVQSLG